MLKMRSDCGKVSSMLFDSCVNCTRQESNSVRETLREISEILQISRCTARRLFMPVKHRLPTGRDATALPVRQPAQRRMLASRTPRAQSVNLGTARHGIHQVSGSKSAFTPYCLEIDFDDLTAYLTRSLDASMKRSRFCRPRWPPVTALFRSGFVDRGCGSQCRPDCA